MSDTDTRSVAEIIGWTKCTLRQAIHNGKTTTYYERPGTSGPSEPTPDDMLAWLTHRDEWCRVVMSVRPATCEVEVHFSDGWLDAQGSTLHDALEAAVRAVAEEETES